MSDADYWPNVAIRRQIVEQELRTTANTLQQLEYRLRVERRIEKTLGDSGAEAIRAIEADMRRMSARFEAYQEILAELDATVDSVVVGSGAANGVEV